MKKKYIKWSPNEFVSLLNDWLIVWCLTSFSTLFWLYYSTQCKYPCYVRDSFTRTPHSILSEPLAAFSHSQRGNHGESEMNPVATTIINPRKEIGLALIKPTTSYSRVLCTTMCYMSQASLWMNRRLQHQCLYLQTIPKKLLCSDPLQNNPDLLLYQKTEFWTCLNWMHLQTTKQMWLKNWNLCP